MAVELDHLFICTDRGAPEAEMLVQFGLSEGPPNVHPGQGTANRRFFFRNRMIELLWVEDADEAQSERTAPLLVWERWSGRRSGACPFGIILRPSTADGAAEPPFPAREYRPAWLPSDQRIYVAPTGVDEPLWVFMPFLTRDGHRQRFTPHRNGAREITRVTLTTPLPLRSEAARCLAEAGVLLVRDGPEYLVTVELDRRSRKEATDFRPELPLVFER